MLSELASQTLERASAAMQTARIACLPEIVKLLNTLSGNTDEVSVIELAEIIQNDPVVMAKVIHAANTYYYNPNAVSVSNVVQAIHVIGFERIRSLAMSLMMAEQVSRGQSPEEQRAVAAQALASGCLAQSIAQNRMLLDKDRAFVCGCMRSFGHMVMASCMSEEYRLAKSEAVAGSENAAYRQVFGLTPLELGYQLLQSANLPEEILITLRALPPAALAALDPTPDERMLAVCEFADRLAALSCGTALTAEEFVERSGALARQYESLLPRLGEELHELIQTATNHLDHITRTFRLKHLPTRTLSRLRACRNAVDPARLAALAQPSAPTSKVPDSSLETTSLPTAQASRITERVEPPSTPSTHTRSRPPTDATPSDQRGHPIPQPSSSLTAEPFDSPRSPMQPLRLPVHDWQASIKQLAAQLSAPGITRAQLRASLLEVIGTGLAARECLLFTHSSRPTEYTLTEGRGQLHERVKSKPTIHLRKDERTIFGVCLQRNENINIHHAHDPKIHAYTPQWLKDQSELGAFVLFPFADGDQTRGVVLAGWPDACQINLPSYHVHAIRTTIAFICKAQQRLAA